MAKTITEITKRDLRELLENVTWHGRLEETEFLARLYPLNDLPSDDPRYKTAEQDIWQHRINNADWPNDWIFSDRRFGLADGEDEDLLRFLTEMLHPAVRKGQEAEALIDKINLLLAPDGYQIVESDNISGRPVYGWKKSRSAAAPIKHFTKDIRPLISTLRELAAQDGHELERAVLRDARAELEEPEYDNWDGGTYYYTLTLTVPVPLFARLGNQGSSLERKISERISQIQRGPDHHRITAVVIQPGMVTPHSQAESDLSAAMAQRSNAPMPQFWTPGQFRLFLSHVSSIKQRTAALRQALTRFHISAFVAHDTIEPGELWQREIEAALRTMDALAAILTPDFSSSSWTDQEVGWALGAGVYVLPVRRGHDPYGFIAEVQGVQGLNKMVSAVADDIFVALLKQPRTHGRISESLVAGFEKSASTADILWNLSLIEKAGAFPASLAQRLERAVTLNRHVNSTPGARERLQRVARAVS